MASDFWYRDGRLGTAGLLLWGLYPKDARWSRLTPKLIPTSRRTGGFI